MASSFFTGNPDNYYGEDCLSILINDGYWNDDNCEYKRGYICKRRGEICCFNCCCWHKQKTIFRVLMHVDNTVLMFPLSGNTPEPPPPHDGNNTSLFDMAACIVTSLNSKKYVYVICTTTIYLEMTWNSDSFVVNPVWILQVSWRRWCARTPLLSSTVQRKV